MRRIHGPLWLYRYYYGSSRWTWQATLIVVLIVGSMAGQVYRWSLDVPSCKRDPDASTSMQIGPTRDTSGQLYYLCRDGWSDVSGHKPRKAPEWLEEPQLIER